jgi:hypothetical protein
MRRNILTLTTIAISALTLGVFQACSDVSFSSANSSPKVKVTDIDDNNDSILTDTDIEDNDDVAASDDSDDGDQGEIDNDYEGDIDENYGCSNGNDKKVLVCHIPPGNPENAHNICISKNALQTHVDHHEDYLGECRSEDEVPEAVTIDNENAD